MSTFQNISTKCGVFEILCFHHRGTSWGGSYTGSLGVNLEHRTTEVVIIVGRTTASENSNGTCKYTGASFYLTCVASHVFFDVQ